MTVFTRRCRPACIPGRAPDPLANQGQLENALTPVSFRLLEIRSRAHVSPSFGPTFSPASCWWGWVAEAACPSSHRPLVSSTRERSASQWTNTRSTSSPFSASICDVQPGSQIPTQAQQLWPETPLHGDKGSRHSALQKGQLRSGDPRAGSREARETRWVGKVCREGSFWPTP